MPVQEQLEYSNAFDNYANWDELRDKEREAWLRLAVLDHPQSLTDIDWASIRQAVAEAKASDQRISKVGPFIFETASVGEKPPERMTAAQLFAMVGYGAEICQPFLRAAAGR